MEKLFTTEDGVDIFKGDKYYSVPVKDFPTNFIDKSKNYQILAYSSVVGPYINPSALKVSGYIKYFAYKPKALEYIKKMKELD